MSPRPPGRAVADAVRSVVAPSTHGDPHGRAERARHIVIDLRATLVITPSYRRYRGPFAVAGCALATREFGYTAIPIPQPYTVHGSRRSSQVGLTSPARRPGPVLHAGWTSREGPEEVGQRAPNERWRKALSGRAAARSAHPARER